MSNSLDGEELLKKNKELEHHVQSLERSNKEWEQFAFIVSHDLQEPLRKIVNFGHLLLETTDSSMTEKTRRSVAVMVDSSTRMADLVYTLLNFARAGQSDAHQEDDVAVEDLWADVLQDLNEKIKATQTRIEKTGPSLTLRGHPLLLYQLFSNIMTNALTYRRDVTGDIKLTIHPAEEEVIFCFQDDGVGIPPEMREKVFEPFFRLHTRAQFPGIGMGLSICRRIMERHQGRIWVAESGREKGTTVCCAFPRHRIIFPPEKEQAL